MFVEYVLYANYSKCFTPFTYISLQEPYEICTIIYLHLTYEEIEVQEG